MLSSITISSSGFDREKALAALDRVGSARDEWIEALLEHEVGFWPATWWDVVHGEVLYREAHALIHGSPQPEDARLLVVRGRALLAIGRAGETRAALDKAIERSRTLPRPGSGGAWPWPG